MTDGDGSENGGDPADDPAEEPDESEERAVDEPDGTSDDEQPEEGTGEDRPTEDGESGEPDPTGEGRDDESTADSDAGTDADSDDSASREDRETGDEEDDGRNPDDELADDEAESAADDSDSAGAFEDGLPDWKKSQKRRADPRPVPGSGTGGGEDGDDADEAKGTDEAEETDEAEGTDEEGGEDEEESDEDAAAAETATDEGQPYRGSTEQPAETAATLEAGGDHAPDDEEMPLADHVEEMVRRLGVILVLMAGVSAVVFPFGEYIINVIWYSFLPGTYELCPTTSIIPRDPSAVITAAATDVGAGPGVTMAEGANIEPACPRVYQPLATIFARLKVATLAGFVVALPGFVYETYLFMRPGLYPRERRYYLAAVPTSLVLATVGVAFAYLLVLPAIFTYFLYYSEGAAEIAFGLTETFDLMVLMMGFFAAIFQIPLFIMLAIMMGVTSRQWLAERRLLFWAAFAGIAFIFNPDPTGMAPFIVAATMIVLFEGTLLLVSWTGSEGILPAPEAVAARRPYAWLAALAGGYLASDAPLPTSYYEQLPGLLRGYIEANNLMGVTPLVVGGLLIAVYEGVVFLLGRFLPVGTWKRRLFVGRISLYRLRAPVWVLSLLVGYFTSPNPFLLERARTVALEPVESAALAVGLIVAFEVLLALWKFLKPDESERLPLER